jgi:competence protein ComEC
VWGLRAGSRCTAGQSWTWDGVAFAVLHPHASDYRDGAKPNALSCVVRIRAASTAALPQPPSALLAGDIESAQEQRLVMQPADLRADLLLVPHHGSRTSSSAAFLDAVAPRLALVQSGYRNRFGHPAAEPMARYAQRSVPVADSPRCGAMAWQSEQPGVVSCHRLQRARYWNHRVPVRSPLQ